MNFSLLLSIYKKEKPEFFDDCMKSVWTTQTLKPTEIVLVKDGGLSDELDSIIADWQHSIGSKMIVHQLPQNVGLGRALNEGLKKCSYAYVARMDTDDISVENRFELQLKYLKAHPNVDILGSQIVEFSIDPKILQSRRLLPLRHLEIVEFSKHRCPMNHPSVIFKKSAIEKVGGYKPLAFLEDYYLWLRLIAAGFRFANIDSDLVKMRAGAGMLSRRRGVTYFKSELSLQYKMLQLNFIGLPLFFSNVLLRGFSRLLPSLVLKFVYKFLRS